jgi:hypothetical protein
MVDGNLTWVIGNTSVLDVEHIDLDVHTVGDIKNAVWKTNKTYPTL